MNFLAADTVYRIMRVHLCCQKTLLWCISAGWLLLAGHAFAESKSMTCDGGMPPKHIELAQGDQNSGNHLQLTRKIAAAASIDMEIDVCSANLTIKGSKNDLLEVTVDIGNSAPKVTAVDYVQAFDVTPERVQLQLRLPKNARAKVVVAVPAATPKLEVNLVRGDLSFETDRIGGKREINVVHGHVEIAGDADAFATMHVDTLMGSFHDHRSGQGAHGLVSQSLTGTGKGSIEVNVVWGSVDLKASD